MSPHKIIVLGAGLVGKSIAIELSKKYDVTCADCQLCSLEALSPLHPVTVIPCDFKDAFSLKQLISSFDLVINAVNSSIGFAILKTIIEEKKNVINISLFSEDAFSLDKLARVNNVFAVINLSAIDVLQTTTSVIAGQIFNNKISNKGVFNWERNLITELHNQ